MICQSHMSIDYGDLIWPYVIAICDCHITVPSLFLLLCACTMPHSAHGGLPVIGWKSWKHIQWVLAL